MQNIWIIDAGYPPLEVNGIKTNNYYSGNDTIYENIARGIIFGCGGNIGELLFVDNCQSSVIFVSRSISIVLFDVLRHQTSYTDQKGQIILLGDFGVILFDETLPNLEGVLEYIHSTAQKQPVVGGMKSSGKLQFTAVIPLFVNFIFDLFCAVSHCL